MITSIFHVDPLSHPSYILHSASPEPGFDLRLRMQPQKLRQADVELEA